MRPLGLRSWPATESILPPSSGLMFLVPQDMVLFGGSVLVIALGEGGCKCTVFNGSSRSSMEKERRLKKKKINDQQLDPSKSQVLKA